MVEIYRVVHNRTNLVRTRVSVLKLYLDILRQCIGEMRTKKKLSRSHVNSNWKVQYFRRNPFHVKFASMIFLHIHVGIQRMKKLTNVLHLFKSFSLWAGMGCQFYQKH